jgi:glucan biosynthesis protein
MKTITMPYEEFLQLEGELGALKKWKAQQDARADEFLMTMTPEQLQEIRTNVAHPLWSAADRQLQQREANAEAALQRAAQAETKKKGFFK